MHQVLLEDRIREKYIFVQNILLLVVSCHILLRQDLEHEINEFYPSVWIWNHFVQNYSCAPSQLHVNVDIAAEISLREDHLEQLWHAAQIR